MCPQHLTGSGTSPCPGPDHALEQRLLSPGVSHLPGVGDHRLPSIRTPTFHFELSSMVDITCPAGLIHVPLTYKLAPSQDFAMTSSSVCDSLTTGLISDFSRDSVKCHPKGACPPIILIPTCPLPFLLASFPQSMFTLTDIFLLPP